MELSHVLKLSIAVFFIVAGLMARYSVGDGWSSIKKYWKLLLFGGIISLMVNLYTIF